MLKHWIRNRHLDKWLGKLRSHQTRSHQELVDHEKNRLEIHVLRVPREDKMHPSWRNNEDNDSVPPHRCDQKVCLA